MSSAKPCLPGCPSVGEYIDSLRVYGKQPEKHLPACPNAEAPKVATNSKGVVTSGYIVPAKPAPEPKQGSAMKPRCAWEPGTPGECSAYLALRAELTQAEKACALALDYVQGSPRPRHMDVVSALREVIARAKEGEKR